MFQFRNDYSVGAHPDVLAALAATNLEGNIGYGADEYCAECAKLIRDLCKAPQADVQFLIGGTKNGALMGEALVICNPDLQPEFFRVKK